MFDKETMKELLPDICKIDPAEFFRVLPDLSVEDLRWIIRSIADCPNFAFGLCFAHTAFLSSSVSPAAASWFCGFLHLPVDPAILGGFCNSPVQFPADQPSLLSKFGHLELIASRLSDSLHLQAVFTIPGGWQLS